MAAILAFFSELIEGCSVAMIGAVEILMVEMQSEWTRKSMKVDGDGKSRLGTSTNCQVRFNRASALPAWTGVSSSSND